MSDDATRVPEKILNRVVDSLHLRVSADAAPSEWLAAAYQKWRAHIEAFEIGDDPLVVELPGLGTFRLLPSLRPYEFKLSNPMIADIRIWNPDKWHSAVEGLTGQIYLDFRSRFLQLIGLPGVHQFVHDLRELMFSGRVRLGVGKGAFCRVARLDLAVDIQMAPLTLADLSRTDGGFIRRSKQSRVNNTLTDMSTGGIVSALLDRKKHLYPPKDNKGGQTYTEGAQRPTQGPTLDGGPWAWPELGVAARAASSAARAVAAAVREEVSTSGKARAAFGHSLVFGRSDLQTVNFGKFGSQLHARIYDKVAAVVAQDKFWVYDVWEAAGWSRENAAGLPVWRTEFSVSGDFLKSLSVPTEQGPTRVDARELEDALAYVNVIWRYCTHNWLRHVHHTEDSNPWRWPSSSWWGLVEVAWLSGVDLKRVHQVKRKQGQRLRPKEEIDSKVEALRAQVQGVAASLQALADIEGDPLVDESTGEIVAHEVTRADLVDQLLDGIKEWLRSENGTEQVAMRRVLMGMDAPSDTALSALYRSQRMAEGHGS